MEKQTNFKTKIITKSYDEGEFKVGLTFQKIFAKLKFSSSLFEKIPSFVCLVFTIENN